MQKLTTEYLHKKKRIYKKALGSTRGQGRIQTCKVSLEHNRRDKIYRIKKNT